MGFLDGIGNTIGSLVKQGGEAIGNAFNAGEKFVEKYPSPANFIGSKLGIQDNADAPINPVTSKPLQFTDIFKPAQTVINVFGENIISAGREIGYHLPAYPWMKSQAEKDAEANVYRQQIFDKQRQDAREELIKFPDTPNRDKLLEILRTPTTPTTTIPEGYAKSGKELAGIFAGLALDVATLGSFPASGKVLGKLPKVLKYSIESGAIAAGLGASEGLKEDKSYKDIAVQAGWYGAGGLAMGVALYGFDRLVNRMVQRGAINKALQTSDQAKYILDKTNSKFDSITARDALDDVIPQLQYRNGIENKEVNNVIEHLKNIDTNSFSKWSDLIEEATKGASGTVSKDIIGHINTRRIWFNEPTFVNDLVAKNKLNITEDVFTPIRNELINNPDIVDNATVKTGKVLEQTFKKFNVTEYVDELNKAKDIARKGETGGVVENIGKFYSDIKAKLVDFNSPIEDVVAKAQKKYKFEILPKADYSNAVDRVLRAPVMAGQFLKDNGLDQVIKKAPNLDFLDQYLIAKQAIKVELGGINTGRNLEKDALLVKQLSPLYEPYAKQVTDYAKKLLDKSVNDNLISKELAEKLKEIYPDYVPLNRVFSELEKSVQPFGTKAVASLSKQTIVQKLQGSSREIESPIASLIQKTNDVFTQGEKNKAAQILASYKDIPGNPLGIVPLRTAENVTKRIDIYKELGVLGEDKKQAEKLLKNSSQWASQLKKEINDLNQQGLDAYLQRGEKETKKFVSSITVKKIPAVVKDNAAKTINELKSSFSIKGILEKEFSSVKNLAFELREGGWSILTEKGLSEATAKSVMRQIFKNPEVIPERIILKDKLIKLKPNEVKDLLNNLINEPPSSIAAIKSKITSKEPILKNTLETIELLNNKVELLKNNRSELYNEAKLLADAKSHGKETFSVIKNGIKEIYEANPEIVQAAKALNVQQLNILGKILAAPVRVAKIGITGLNPAFILSNIARDTQFGFITSQHSTSLANPVTFLESLYNAAGHGKLYQNMVREGAGGTSFDIARNQIPQTIKKIRSNKNIVSKIGYTVTHPAELFRTAEDIVGRSEEFSRLQQYQSTYKALIGKGRTIEDATILAAKAARGNTANFMRRGEWGTVLNSAFLYLNASIQGSRSFIKAMKTNPIKTSAKLATGLFTPVAIATAWNLSDDARREVYKDIQDYEKDNNLIFIPPQPVQDESGKWNIIKIPLPPGVSKLTVPVRKVIEGTQGMDSAKFMDFAKAIIGSVLPVEPETGSLLSTLTPQAIKPTLEAYANKNFFTGLPQVSQSMEKLSPELQVKKDTSGTAEIIADALKVSPIKTEEFIKGTFGSLASNILNATDKFLAGNDLIPEDKVGGKSFIDSIKGRFTKASGGKIEQEQSNSLESIIQNQSDERYKVKQEAELIYQDLSKLPVNEANAKALAIKQLDPELYNTLVDTIEESKLGLTYPEKLMKMLWVENGERAKFIYEQSNKFATPEEKNSYVADLKRKKIISDSVMDQLKELIATGTVRKSLLPSQSTSLANGIPGLKGGLSGLKGL